MCSVRVQRGINPSGRGCAFGADIVAQFCHRNDIQVIARGHQVVMGGYRFMLDTNTQLVTLFSTPNYMGKYGNVGAFLQVDEHLVLCLHVFDGDPTQREEEGTSIPDHFVYRAPATH